MSNATKYAYIIACIVLSILPFSLAWSQPPLAAGTFLVATDKIDEGMFKESVVLVLRHNAEMTIGVIVNKPSEMQLAKVFPDHGLPESDAKLYFGGPVNPMAVSAMSMTKRPHPSMAPLVDDIYWVPGLRALGHIVTQVKGEERVRAYMGVSSWKSGQLQAELAAGAWLVAPVEGDMVFSEQPATLWSQLYVRWSGRWL